VVNAPPETEHPPATDDTPVVEIARRLAPVLRALSDENRLAILLTLARHPHSVRELSQVTGLAQSLVSHHLAPLREAGVVTVTAVGRSNRYALCCQALAAPVRLLSELAGLSTPTTSCSTPPPAPESPPAPAPPPD
jgi:DNA-binding transcriptional ArsR family regulator